jgi:uncharacterized delta-60 repeat protein
MKNSFLTIRIPSYNLPGSPRKKTIFMHPSPFKRTHKNHRVRIFCWLGIVLFSSLAAQALDSVDPGFAPIIRGPGTVRGMEWNPGAGWLYVSVSGDKLNGQVLTTSLVRFDAAGIWDSSYAPVINGTVSRMQALADGKMLIAGSFTSVDGHATSRLARLLSDGTVDTEFAVSGGTLPSSITALTVATDGVIYLGTSGFGRTKWTPTGYETIWPQLLYKVSAAGVVDASYACQFGLVNQSGTSYYSGSTVALNALWVTTSGDVLVGGNFTQVNGVAKNYLAKLSPSGVLDASYQAQFSYTQSSGYNSYSSIPIGVSVIADAGDGKVYTGGTFNIVNGYTQTGVARLNSDGTLDPWFRVNFSSGTLFSSSQPGIASIVVDTTGRLVLVGSFGGVDGLTKSNVARVDAFGRLDVSFSTNFGNNDYAVLLPDNAVVFGRTGSLSVNGIVQPPIGRVAATGVGDTNFRPDLRKRRYPDWIVQRPLQGPVIGSIWIKEINGLDASGGVAALGEDGAVDTAFASNLAINGTVNAGLVLQDGRILLGGSFSSVGGQSRPRLALVEANGTLVTTFNLGAGPDSTVDKLRLLPSGKILVGGSFTNLNGEECRNVALLDLNWLTATQGLIVEEILEARYGTDLLYSDVRTRVSNALVNGAVNLAISTTSMGGDPAPGATKYLTVRFRTNRGERTVKIRDNTTLKLPNIAWDSGLVDREFRPKHTESLSLADAAEQVDGKLILLGSFSTFAGQGNPRLVRLFPDGTLDSTFLPHGQFSSFYPDLVRVALDGSIYLAGSSMMLNGGSSSRQIYRLLANGTYDPSFACPSFLSTVEDLQIQPDGSVWCCGSFSSSAAGERNRVARLLPNGNVDTRFDAGDSASFTINMMALDAPDRLWIAGSFTSVQGVTRDGVALINLTSGIAPLAQVVPTSIATEEGKTVRFDLTKVGRAESYIWRHNGVPLPGENGASLTVSSVEPVHAGSYTAQVTNTAGSTSSAGLLAVQEADFGAWLALRGLSEAQAHQDPDGDGVSNAAEYLARTNPGDSRSVFSTKLEKLPSGVRLRWTSYPGRRYLIEESTNLATWTVRGDAIAGDGNEKEVEMPISMEDGSLFWRVQVSK